MLIYISKRGKQIVFDDYAVEEEYNNAWTYMCKHHHNIYRGILGNRCGDVAIAGVICSVDGCDREADYYVDFNPSEVVERSE